MATSVARGHGGDGGDRPPQGDPARQPTGCESSEPKRRGKGKNITLIEKFEKANCQPLPIEFDVKGRQFKSVGENAQDFISNEIAKIAPFHYSGWVHVPDHFKKTIFPTLFEYFDLESWRNTDLWGGIKNGIHAECKRAYRERKAVFKARFEKFGGCDDVERAKENCPEDLDQQRWEELIDLLFVDQGYRRRCEKNKSNRTKQRYASYHGSKSYAQRRHMEGTGAIEVFRKTHYKLKTGWVDAKAQSDYVKMREELTKSTQESGDRSSVDEIGCIQRALGHRRGHIKGVGRVVRRPTLDVSDTYPPQERQWQTQIDDQVKQLQQQLQQQQERENERDRQLEETRRLLEQQTRQLEEMRRLLEQQNRRNP